MDMFICRDGVNRCNGGSCIIHALGVPTFCPYSENEVVDWVEYDKNKDFKQPKKRGEHYPQADKMEDLTPEQEALAVCPECWGKGQIRKDCKRCHGDGKWHSIKEGDVKEGGGVKE